jgi:hypothetical protein
MSMKAPVEGLGHAQHASLAAVLWQGGPVADLQIAGSRAAARRFLKLFAA